MTGDTIQPEFKLKGMTPADRLRRISEQEFLALGLDNIAYVKEVEIDGGTAVAICAANGRQIALAPDISTAVRAAWQNGLAPVTVH